MFSFPSSLIGILCLFFCILSISFIVATIIAALVEEKRAAKWLFLCAFLSLSLFSSLLLLF
ncbi:MAG: hypothetical protein WC435_00575 [Candidatus Paceibacterota bacterium]